VSRAVTDMPDFVSGKNQNQEKQQRVENGILY
jgi:hypothetical protein